MINNWDIYKNSTDLSILVFSKSQAQQLSIPFLPFSPLSKSSQVISLRLSDHISFSGIYGESLELCLRVGGGRRGG